MTHPTLEQLRRLLADELPGEQDPLAQHVNGCDECLERLERLQRGDARDLRLLAQMLVHPPEEAARVDLPPTVQDSRPLEEGERGSPAGWPEFAGYELLERVGQGGMGEVYRARQRSTQRVVALKTVLPGCLPDDPQYAERLARFRTEAEAVSRLQHPHIVSIYEVGESNGRPYFTMEWVAGGTLAALLGGKPQPERQAAEWVEVLARTMHHAHERGIVHRDLKPANVLLSSAACGLASGMAPDAKPQAAIVPKISDFGLAKLLDRRTLLTRPLQALGTPDYMAPEQAGDVPGLAKVGPATDVWSLGVILYEILIGRPPFRADEPFETLRQVRDDEPVSPRRLRPKLSRDLETITLKCLQKDPRRRYGSALELGEDLRRFLDGDPIQARPVGLTERLWRRLRRRPLLAGMIMMSVVVLALMVVLVDSYRALRDGHAARVRNLAREVDDQLRLVKHAVLITAQQEKLADLFRQNADNPEQLRHGLAAFLGGAKTDFNKWFTWSGKEPLVNLFILDATGTILADSALDARAVGMNFDERDYSRFVRQGGAMSSVYVSQVFRSHQDGLYKFAVVALLRDGDKLLGALAATLPIGSSIVALDMADQPEGAIVTCPMDWSYADKDDPAPLPDEFVVALHAGYGEPGKDPAWGGEARRPALRAFAQDPHLARASERWYAAGAFVEYARVDDTPFVAVLQRPYPWPMHLLFSRRVGYGALALLIVAGVGVFWWWRHQRGERS